MTAKPICHLQISALELSLHLGWPEEERKTPQQVFLDIDIHYPEAPKACQSDQLGDTVCYDLLVKAVKEKTAACRYHLVEHACHEIYHLVRLLLPKESSLRIRLLKYPKIADLTGGVYFSYGDF